jgi:hypothetical protein
MFGIKFYCPESALWLNDWGIYVLPVPTLLFLSAAFSNNFTITHLLAFAIGTVISILLVRGNWHENYVLQKIAATILGTSISIVIYSLWLKKVKINKE